MTSRAISDNALLEFRWVRLWHPYCGQAAAERLVIRSHPVSPLMARERIIINQQTEVCVYNMTLSFDQGVLWLHSLAQSRSKVCNYYTPLLAL